MLCEFSNWAQVLILSFAAVGVVATLISALETWRARNEWDGY